MARSIPLDELEGLEIGIKEGGSFRLQIHLYGENGKFAAMVYLSLVYVLDGIFLVSLKPVRAQMVEDALAEYLAGAGSKDR